MALSVSSDPLVPAFNATDRKIGYFAVVNDLLNLRASDVPMRVRAWAVFVRRTATVFGARGVHRWIIWNEPDIPFGVHGQEWAGSIAEYYRLLKVAYLGSKDVDREAYVHLVGLTL
jgi:hypothetical protein